MQKGGVLAAIGVFFALTAGAEGARAVPRLVPDAPLRAKAATYERQERAFTTLENGLFLDAIVKATEVDGVKAFFAQTAQTDFRAFAGKHPYDVLDAFGEYADEGNFAGIASVGIAARLLVLRRDGASADDVARARDAAVRAARTWHVYAAIGGPGIVARGVRKLTPDDAGAPPSPGAAPELVPLKDGNLQPLPAKKAAVWRAPVAPGFDGWVWLDDTSKDQVSGYALGATWLWDALTGDPAVPRDVLDALAADLTAFAKSLMQVAPEYGIDLCIRDADGRLTSFHDLSPRQLVPDAVIAEDITLRNGFNAALALGIVRAAYHVGGDPEVGRYYYEDLVGRRNLPKSMAETAGFIFLGAPTNFSNVNMLTIALATLGRTETDPYVLQKLKDTLEHQYWSTPDSRDVSHVQQAWFDAVYGAYTDASATGLGDRMHASLAGMQDAPAFSRDRTNCDDAEIAAGSCVAVDGVTVLELESTRGHGGSVVAKGLVPWSVRPDSDFAWRSDPFAVNGSASTTMNAGGDFLAAYWLAQVSDTDRTKNTSPNARAPLPYVFVDPSAGAGDDAGGLAASPTPSSRGCASAGGAHAPWAGVLLALAATVGVGVRRRHSRARNTRR